MKLPNAAGIDGMMNRNTMMRPCSVNTWLYASAVMMVCFGVSSSMRTSNAMMPPRKNAVNTDHRYITPMRLWSTVYSHVFMPFGELR
jgi:hypothetical protein